MSLAEIIFQEIGSEDLDYIKIKLDEAFEEIVSILASPDYFTFIDISNS